MKYLDECILKFAHEILRKALTTIEYMLLLKFFFISVYVFSNNLLKHVHQNFVQPSLRNPSLEVLD